MRAQLRKIGLLDQEITIYLLLLRSHGRKAAAIAKQLSFARSTVYRFLDSLQEKGLVTEATHNNVKSYSAVRPDRIPELLDERKAEIQSIIPELSAIVPESTEETKVELFKGNEGMKAVMNNVIGMGKPYTIIGEMREYYRPELEVGTYQWMRKAEKLNIRGRVLLASEHRPKLSRLEAYRFLPKELIPEISLATCGSTTIQFIWSNPIYVIVIENAALAKSHRKMFAYLWKQAKEPSAKHKKFVYDW